MNPLTVSASETALRLNNLQQYVPDADETLCAFARYLATRLDPEVTPTQFQIDWLLAINHWPHGDYNKVKECADANLQKVVNAIFPADFAKEIEGGNNRLEVFMKEVRERRTAA